LTDTLDQIKKDLLKAGATDFLIATPESFWIWTPPADGIIYGAPAFEVTMEVREGVKSIGTIHTADGLTFQVYKQSHSKEPSMTDTPSKIEYRFDEDKLLAEIGDYIAGTYSKHYATNGGIQAMDAITATGAGLGFCVGNILKYAWRLGKKDGFNKLDIMKVIHYSIILMFIMKKETK
jgi:hypothetical protein